MQITIIQILKELTYNENNVKVFTTSRWVASWHWLQRQTWSSFSPLSLLFCLQVKININQATATPTKKEKNHRNTLYNYILHQLILSNVSWCNSVFFSHFYKCPQCIFVDFLQLWLYQIQMQKLHNCKDQYHSLTFHLCKIYIFRVNSYGNGQKKNPVQYFNLCYTIFPF